MKSHFCLAKFYPRNGWRSRTAALLSITLAIGCGMVLAAAEPPMVEPNREAARLAHGMLTRLCDDFGGRLTGSENNRLAMDRLSEELRSLGFVPERKSFSFPGWERGDDRVDLLVPFRRPLRAAALSYTEPHAAFEGPVIDLGRGRDEDFPKNSLQGCIGLLDSSTESLRSILITAEQRGLVGLLATNREDGGQLLARTGSFSGKPLPLPVYSITQEEGRWLKRLLARGQPARVRMETRSRCVAAQTSNLVVRIPGRTDGLLIVGAHFDSWDLGQGALDNGLGTAQLFALAHLLRDQKPLRTIELVWFNGEEQGLWGSRHAARELGDAPVVAMLNLDMVGVGQAVNALGDDSLVPALERWNESRGTRKLPLGVQNSGWFGSDHTPYQMVGVRALTLNGPIDRAAVRFYHDFADTIDKLPESLLADSTDVIADLVVALANDDTLTPFRRSSVDTVALFEKSKMLERLKAVEWWPLGRAMEKL